MSSKRVSESYLITWYKFVYNNEVLLQTPSILSPESNEDNLFFTLKKMRDIECVKLNESSNILKTIMEKPTIDWKEQLVAETILLENGKFEINHIEM